MLERFKDSLWCSWCYSNSLYPLAIPKHALVRVLVPLGADGSDHTLIVSNWDDNKWERLYDIIDRVGLDWERVRIEMGSDVTVRECMYHFIIAPLEQDTRGLIRLPVCFGNVYNGRDEIPFFTSENTITAFLAFCASMLSPVVASRAAKVILDRVMQEISPSPQSTIGKESEWSAKDAESMGPNAPIFLDSYQVNSASQGEDFHDLGFMMSGGQRLRGNSSLYGFRAKPTDQYIGTGAEYESTGPSFISNHTIDDATLYGAFKDALQSSTDTCSELAEMQQEKINDLLEQLIELKIKRIKHKLNVYASTCEQMNNNEVKMVSTKALMIDNTQRLELSQILQCDSNT
ncbi:SWI/SNF complex subunit SMARCC2 [Babesia divergens]|uniref:SWI/SNF complex subunit SMARCC2 n=1 Tax=Babesia divergens TaxID=32595 RepID=A0AAD9G7M9_BABDI|nr:SWI/SNF complex subunit SMARCC2 [Babesia divergens]